MGENAILELRTVNVQEDVRTFLASWNIKFVPAHAFESLKRQLVIVDDDLSMLLAKARFEQDENGVYHHPDGSRIVAEKTVDESIPSWCAHNYRGDGNPATITPVLQAMQAYYDRTAGLQTRLDRF